MHRGALVEGYLGRQVGGTPEAVDAEPAPRSQRRAPESAVADDAGTEQRGCLGVGEHVGDLVGVPLVDDRELAVAAVGVPTCEPWRGAEVLVAAPAEPAHAARGAQPGDPHALTLGEAPGVPALCDHVPDHLVAWDDTGAARGEVALHEVKVRSADPADMHLHEDLMRPWLRDRALDEA